MDLLPSACIWSETGSIEQMLRSLKQTAFHYVDVEPSTLDAANGREILKQLGLKVSCVALDHNLPTDCSWDRDAESVRRAAAVVQHALDKCEALDAAVGYVGPPRDQKMVKTFGDAVAALSDHAAERGVKLCVEHVPKRALPTARQALAFVQQLNKSNLYLLLDVGHTLISKERAWEVAAAAGPRLGYVQLNDNDGKDDLHWPLLDGVLKQDDLARTLAALKAAGYQGTLGLELKRYFHLNQISAFSKNHNLLLRLQQKTAAAAAPAAAHK